MAKALNTNKFLKNLQDMQIQGDISDAEASNLLSQAESKTKVALQRQRAKEIKLEQLLKQKESVVRHMIFDVEDDETTVSGISKNKYALELKKKRV